MTGTAEPRNGPSAHLARLVACIGVFACLGAAGLAGCAAPEDTTQTLGSSSASSGSRMRTGGTAGPAASAVPGASAAPAARGETAALTGVVVVLDPGHNGANARNARTVAALVPDGRGGRKACNTTGTATSSGYAEHALVWDVAGRAAALLRGRGATVVLTRADDDGVGPCVHERGAFAGAHHAAVLVSLHANGSVNPAATGFHVIVPNPPLNPAQDGPSAELADRLVAALAAEGFAPNGAYPQGVSRRSDVATLNWSTVPAAMLELGEMRNRAEARVMQTEAGRARYAQAVAAGIEAWALARR